MKSHRLANVCTFIAVVFAAAISRGAEPQTAGVDPALPPFEFRRTGAASPEDAATALFRGCAMKSPNHFVQHLLLGVCDGPIATLQDFAECLHVTRFAHGDESYSVYDMPEPIDRNKPVRVIASEEFDSDDKRVDALQIEMMSTYYGQTFRSVDVAAESYDGREYRTRIVVARVNDRWYAMPRCRSAKSFYAIADSM
jgi:hypothetical protein